MAYNIRQINTRLRRQMEVQYLTIYTYNFQETQDVVLVRELWFYQGTIINNSIFIRTKIKIFKGNRSLTNLIVNYISIVNYCENYDYLIKIKRKK